MLAFALFLFNDPIYVTHIYAPSFASFAFAEFIAAVFYSSILTFWLRELAMFRPKKADPKWNCLKKAVFAG